MVDGNSRRDGIADVLRTPLCELLGIDLPILQAPMAPATTAAMVAAVSGAGGLGILAAMGMTPDQLRAEINAVREKTARPFGVNLILHRELQPPADPATVSDHVWSRSQSILDRFRGELGIQSPPARPARIPDTVPALFDVILDERVPVWSIGLGQPTPDQMRRSRDAGMKVVAMACTVQDALALADSGVDAIIAQGGEAGGHRSTWMKRPSDAHAAVGTMVLVPQIAARVKVPVIAAGGISVGSQLAAALVLGASGVLLGTRFIATRESKAPEFYKQALVDADSDDTRITDVFTGLYARALRNRYSEEYIASGAPVLPALVQQSAAADIYAAAGRRGDRERTMLLAGQGCGLVDSITSSADVVQALAAEARAALERVGTAVGVRAV